MSLSPPNHGSSRRIEQKIREATEACAFDDIEGSGRPIPDIDLP